MSLQLQDEPHSPLPALPFPAIHYLANTSTSSNMLRIHTEEEKDTGTNGDNIWECYGLHTVP